MVFLSLIVLAFTIAHVHMVDGSEEVKAGAVAAKANEEKHEATIAEASASAAKAEEGAAKLKAAAETAEAKNTEEEKETFAEVGLTSGQEWAFVTDSKSNVVAIKKGPSTGTGKTEVHRLNAADDYSWFDLHTATPLHLTDKTSFPDSAFDFVMDSKDNLIAIKKGPYTGTGTTEIHRMTASSNYNQYDLQIGTGLDYTDENWAFTMDSKDNLICILKGPSNSGKTEVHRLTAASNYKNFDLHTATGLQRTHKSWHFAMDPQDNLVCILEGPASGSGKTEVHKLSAASSYKDFNLHTSTALVYSEGWEFAMAKDDVVAINKGPTSESCMTEVHKLSGAANYGQFDLHTGTALDLCAVSSSGNCPRSFGSPSELDASPWGAYYKAIYGALPLSGYPINPFHFWMLYDKELRESGVHILSVGKCPSTYPWPNQRYTKNDYYQPSDISWLWHPYPYHSVHSNSWAEVIHEADPFGDEHFGAWFLYSPGSGIYFHVGKTIAFAEHGQAYTHFGVRAGNANEVMSQNAARAGYDSIQFLAHIDHVNYPCDNAHGLNYRAYMGIEIVGVKLVGTYACATQTGSSPSIRSGWEHSQPCTCDARQKFLNCRLSSQLQDESKMAGMVNTSVFV